MTNLISFNIQISELDKEISSEAACAQEHRRKAQAIDEKLQTLERKRAILIEQRDALPSEPEEV